MRIDAVCIWYIEIAWSFKEEDIYEYRFYERRYSTDFDAGG